MFARRLALQAMRRAAPQVLPTLLVPMLPALFSLLLAACASNAPAPVVHASRPPGAASAAPQAPQAAPAAVAPSTGATPGAATPGYTVKKGDTLHGIALDQGLSYRDLAAWNGIENPNKILVGQQLRLTPPEANSQVASTRAVMGPVPVEARALDGSSANTDKLKREPKGGKQPYSEAALARLQQGEAPPVASIAPETKTEVSLPPKPVSMPASPAPAMPPAAAPPATTQANDAVDWVWPASGKLIAMFVEGTNKGIDIAAKTGDPVMAAASGKVVYAGTGLRGYGKLVIVKHSPMFLSAYAHNSQILVKEGQNVARGQKIAEAGSTDSEQPELHFEIRRQGKPVDPLKHLPGRAP